MLGHYLSKFAGFLTAHEKYSLARRVMHVVVRWNEFWMGSESPALAPALKQAAVVSALSNKSWWHLVKRLSDVRRGRAA